jgi:membrane protease YdiL (CAAX protease family)
MSSIPPPETFGEPPAPPAADPPARLWAAPAALLLGLGIGVFATILVEIIGEAFGSSLSHPSPAVSLIGDLVFDLSFVIAALYFSAIAGMWGPADFGYRRTPVRLGITAVALAGAGYYALTWVYGTLLNLHGNDKLPNELGVTKHTAALVGAAVFVCVIAPMAEEFFFRGFLFGVLRRMRVMVGGRDIGIWIAALIVGVLFGAAHLGSASPKFLVPLGFLGFVLCMIRWRTDSLYPCMALHSLNNCLALGVNQLSWTAPEILALMVGSLAIIATVTGPLADRERWPIGPRAGRPIG